MDREPIKNPIAEVLAFGAILCLGVGMYCALEMVAAWLR